MADFGRCHINPAEATRMGKGRNGDKGKRQKKRDRVTGLLVFLKF